MKILIKVLGADIAAKLFTEGRVSRLDLALDIRKPLGNYFVFMKGLRKTEIYLDADGAVESQILGSSASNKRLTLYNKAAEQCLPDTGDKHWWRLEFALRNLEYPVAGFDAGLLKHFQEICFISRDILDDDYFDRRFLRQVVKHGLNFALHPLDRNTKDRYLRRLAKHEIHPVDLQHLGFKRGLASVSFLDMGQMGESAA